MGPKSQASGIEDFQATAALVLKMSRLMSALVGDQRVEQIVAGANTANPCGTLGVANFTVFAVQCGHDSTEDVLRPRLVPDLQGIPIRQVAPGLWHTACLTEDGGLYTWGGNADGQLGTGLPVGAVRTKRSQNFVLEMQLPKLKQIGDECSR